MLICKETLSSKEGPFEGVVIQVKNGQYIKYDGWWHQDGEREKVVNTLFNLFRAGEYFGEKDIEHYLDHLDYFYNKVQKA